MMRAVMVRYVVRRLLLTIPVLLGVATLVFAHMRFLTTFMSRRAPRQR